MAEFSTEKERFEHGVLSHDLVIPGLEYLENIVQTARVKAARAIIGLAERAGEAISEDL